MSLLGLSRFHPGVELAGRPGRERRPLWCSWFWHRAIEVAMVVCSRRGQRAEHEQKRPEAGERYMLLSMAVLWRALASDTLMCYGGNGSSG